MSESIKKAKLEEINEAIRFFDLDATTQQIILEKKSILFQGNEKSLKELLVSLEKVDLDEVIDKDILLKISKNEKILVGRELKPLDEAVEYLPRNILTSNSDSSSTFSNPFSEKLLRQLDYSNSEGVLITICGPDGTGKSTALTYLANIIKNNRPYLWVMKLNLCDYLKAFSEFKKDNLRPISLLNLINSKPESKLRSEFEEKIFSMTDKLVIILDGINEIYADYEDIVLDLIADLRKRCEYRYFKNRLENLFILSTSIGQKFGLEPIYLEPFSQNDQVDFLKNYWERKLHLNDVYKEKCKIYAEAVIKRKWPILQGVDERVGTALMIRMLAEILEKRDDFEGTEWEGCSDFLTSTNTEPLLPKKISLVEMYQLYIHKNCSGHFKTRLNSIRSVIMSINEECNGCFYNLALDSILSKEHRQYFSSYKTNVHIPEEKLLTFGILEKNYNELQFTHRTFAEYFMAECISKELQKTENVQFLKLFLEEILMTSRFTVVRIFFDTFIKEDLNILPEETFTGIGHALKRIDNNFVLYTLAKEGCLGILKFIDKCLNVADVTIDINSVSVKGKFVLHAVLEGDYVEVFEFLVEKDLRIDTRSKNDRTALHLAAEKGNLAIVKFLLERNIDVNSKDRKGLTALHIAPERGCLEMVKCLLDHGANIKSRCQLGTTALHKAALAGDLNKVRYLVENGAEINCKSNGTETTLYNAVASGNLSTVRYLIDEGADVTLRTNTGETILQAIHKWKGEMTLQKVCEMVKFLVDKGLDINSTDYSGNTLLHTVFVWRFKYRTVEFVKFLLELGADIRIFNENDHTPLTYAMLHGDLSTVKYLMENGAEFNAYHNQDEVLHTAVGDGNLDLVRYFSEKGVNLNIKNSYGLSTINKAVYYENLTMAKLLVEKGVKIEGVKMIKKALEECDLEMVKLMVENAVDTRADLGEVSPNGDLAAVKFLVDKGYSFRAFKDVGGSSELLKYAIEKNIEVNKAGIFFKAAVQGDLGIIKLLLENGVDVNARGKEKRTALHEAAKYNRVYIIKYVLNQGAEINANDSTGSTPLFYAVAHHGCLETVRFLVDKGADVNSRRNDGKTVFVAAVESGDFESVKFLATCGITREDFGKAICAAFTCGHLGIAEYLAETDPSFNCKLEDVVKAVVSVNSDTKLDTELRDGIFSRLGNVEYVLERGVEVMARDINDYKLLIKAAKDSDLNLIKCLVEVGGDVNAVDDKGRGALHQTTDLNVVKILVEHGANVNAEDTTGCSVLREAMKKSNLDVCKFLIENGAKINEEDKDGRTLLHMSIYDNDFISFDKIKYLLEMGARLSLTKNGRSVLHDAISPWYRDLDMIKYLVRIGVEVNSRDAMGCTPLDEAAARRDLDVIKFLVENGAKENISKNKEVLLKAVEECDLDIVKYLVEKGADVNSKGKNGRTPLHEAAQRKCFPIGKFLVDSGADVNALANKGVSVLHIASHTVNYYLNKYLVENGVYINFKARDGHAALHYALLGRYGGSFPVLKLLVENGAYVNICDNEGATALHIAAGNGNRRVKRNEFLQAMKFLIENGARVDVRTAEGRTPLHEAASEWQLEKVELLVRNGADVNAKDEHGLTPLFAVVLVKDIPYDFDLEEAIRIIEFLVRSGANIAEEADNGRVVLQEACILGRLEMVEVLVKMGADINVKSRDGRTPLLDAAQGGTLKIVDFLLRRGADFSAKTPLGYSALDVATRAQHVDIVEFLTKC